MTSNKRGFNLIVILTCLWQPDAIRDTHRRVVL
jgi:hypothetical protein